MITSIYNLDLAKKLASARAYFPMTAYHASKHIIHMFSHLFF